MQLSAENTAVVLDSTADLPHPEREHANWRMVPLTVRFGETEMVLEEVVTLGVGSVIELNSGIDQPVELVVNNRVLARGDVVTIDGFYGIRITEITSAGERFKSLNS